MIKALARDGACAPSRTFDGAGILRERASNATGRASLCDQAIPVTSARIANVPGGAHAPPGASSRETMGSERR